MRNSRISAPTIIKMRCAARSVGQPSAPARIFFINTGSRVKNAAPMNEPKMEPSPARTTRLNSSKTNTRPTAAWPAR